MSGQTAVVSVRTYAPLVKLQEAANLLAQVRNAKDAKRIMDVAIATKVYAKKAALGQEAVDFAHAIKIDAQRMLGEFLKQAPKNVGAKPGKTGIKTKPVLDDTPTLADIGITKKLSAESQKLVEVAEAPALYQQVRDGKLRLQQAVKRMNGQKKREDREAEAQKATADIEPGDDHGVHHGDFRELSKDIADASVNLIFTDPPYDRPTLPLYGDLAQAAARILKPGGSLICYLGQYQIGEVCQLIQPHLRLWWTLCCLHTGRSARMDQMGIVVKWKPMLWFVKGTRRDKETFVDDLIESRMEKDAHAWQQSVVEASYYIEKLTIPGEMVFDPFCGGGTTAVAAKKLGRRWLTCDVDPDSAALARKRVSDTAV